MLRALAFSLLLVAPLAARADCGGQDMIAALPEAERAALEAGAAAAPYPEGLLWQATRGQTTLTLFGTYHFRHAATDAHLERLKPLIAAADQVWLEVSTDDQAAFQRQIAEDPSIMFITEGPTLPDLLGETDWARLSDEMTARAIPAFMAAKFKPLWAAMMLGIGPCEVKSGALEGKGIDALVGLHAAETGNPSRSLEDFAEVLAMLDSDPLEKQVEMIRLTLSWPGNPDDLSYTIRQLYLDQKVALTWEYSRALSLKYGGPTAEADFAWLEKVLLTDRNTAWVDRLLQQAEGRSAFIAAGAGHLPGETGLLRLLEQQGFEVSRLPF